MFGIAVCVLSRGNKSQPLGAAGLSDSKEAEHSGLSLAYFHPVQISRQRHVLGTLSLTVFGQHSDK